MSGMQKALNGSTIRAVQSQHKDLCTVRGAAKLGSSGHGLIASRKYPKTFRVAASVKHNTQIREDLSHRDENTLQGMREYWMSSVFRAAKGMVFLPPGI